MREPRQLSLFEDLREEGLGFREPSLEPVRRAELEAPAPREVRRPILDPEVAVRERLEALMNERFTDFVLTDNKRRIVSLHPARGGGRVLRIHRCFLSASEPTLSLCCLQGKSTSETEQSPDSGNPTRERGIGGRRVVEGSSASLAYAWDYQDSVHSNLDLP